uniref:Uncharacterized protein n=1 Tax=Graphocephala atropunctata TaxID=36148 RepID=A0A1B6ME00_9HEMI
MSPAPQGTLEVEKYIGSYLISQRIPPNANKGSNQKRYQNQQQHHVKPKNYETEKIRNFNKFCFPGREHVGGSPRYTAPPGQMPLPVDCPGYNNHYGKHNPGGSGWAGVPLISMTSSHHRRNKKVLNPPQGQKYNHRPDHQNGFVKGKDSEDNSQHDPDRSPLTRLAIHTQGAPLIQAGRYNNRSRGNYPPTRVYRGDAAPPATTPNKDQPCGNTDNLSVASDESSGNSENSLPRIIKPRKRRKKDRKPIPGATTATSSTPNESSQYARAVSSPVVPSRYEHSASAANSSENNTTDLLSETHVTPVKEKQSEDLIDPLASADEFPFGNLLDDEEDRGSELSSCAPATLCQCRYCDPSGVIWDVDQRCYSPFLTPPSPTDRLFRPYRQPSPSHYFNGDLGVVLRRSWSDPSPNYILPSPEHVNDKREVRSSSPAGLQVSSEIVTSLNGHRDIEIKFFSSPSPSESSKAKIGGSDRDLSDRCFVVEE